MKYRYGGYTHDEGTVTLQSVQKQKTYSPRGQPTLLRVTHQCAGELLATPGSSPASMQTELRTKILTMESAYSRDGEDAGLLHNDGSPSVHYLYSNDSYSGTKVTQPPSFPSGAGAEYAAFRSFSFSIYADFLAENMEFIYDFKESLTFQGSGGPKYVVTELDTGRPDIQRVNRYTAQTVVQAGVSVGIGSWPSPQSQIYGTGEVFQGHRSSVSYQPATKLGNNYWLHPTSWNYVFTLSTPGKGYPARL